MRIGAYSGLALLVLVLVLVLVAVLALVKARHHKSTPPLTQTTPTSATATGVVDALVRPPVTLRYAANGVTNGIGLNDPVFWVTNHTDSILSLSLNQIEINAGGAWINYASPKAGAGPLIVRGPRTNLGNLGPRQGGYASLPPQFGIISVPTNSVWRAEVSVAEMLTGLEEVVAGVQQMPRTMKMRSRFGITNVPINPLSSEVTRWGHHRVVYSELVGQP